MAIKLIEKDTGILGYGQDILYAEGKYWLVSESPAKICYSEDLENWTEIKLNDDHLEPSHLAYGNGIFVLTGSSGYTSNTYIYYSNDGGYKWVPVTISTGQTFSINSNTCKFINNRFIFTLGYYNYTISTGIRNWTTILIYESKDGKNWTKHSYKYVGSKEIDPMDIEYHNGLYVLVGETGSIFTSPDLNNWTQRTSGVTNKLVGISYGKNKFVISGDKGTILTSSDGKNWTKQESGTTSYLIRSRYSNGMYIVVGYNATILQSIDGELWTNISNKSSGLRYGLTVNDNRFVISSGTYVTTGTIPIFYFDVTRVLAKTSDSSLFFFNQNLNLLGIIDYFISLRWQRKYFEAGEFEIVLPVNNYTLKLIDFDVLIMRNNYTEAGIIENIEFNDNGTDEEVTISGRFLSSLLERRIVKSKINFSGNTIEGMNTIVDAMTPLTDLWETEVVSMSSKTITFQCTYKNVYEYLCKLSQYSAIAFRIVPNVDAKVYMFEVWQGKDRSADQNENEQYSFSDDNYNIEQGSLVLSHKTKVTYCLVGGSGEDTARILSEVDDGSTGFDRYEVFSDQKSLSSDNLSTTDYQNQLKTVGEGNLSDGSFQLEVTATNVGDYKNKWDLGDIVNVKKEKWGVQTTKRIIEVEEIIEDGKRTIYPTFGSPLTSTWEDD